MDAKAFFNKQRQRVADVQKKIARDTLGTLYENSPHIGDPDSPWSEGEYEINHRLSINGKPMSLHRGPIGTSSKEYQQAEQMAEDFFESIMSGSDPEQAMSTLKQQTGLAPDQLPAAIMSESTTKAINLAEQALVSNIECGDSVTISNDTGHAPDVEDGGVHWRDKPNGYGTYRKTRRAIKAKYSNVIK